MSDRPQKKSVKVREKRSPSYPKIGLSTAIIKADALYNRESRSFVPKSSAVKAWGYSSISGPALQMLSTLNQYGLIETRKNEIKVSDKALLLIMGDKQTDEWKNTLIACALSPKIFKELIERYNDGLPSDDALKTQLMLDSEYNEKAAKVLIKAFRETYEYANLESYNDNLDSDNEEKSTTKTHSLGFDDLFGLSSRTKEEEMKEWKKDFQWQLSDETTAILTIYGKQPDDADLQLLSDYIELAKKALLKKTKESE